MNQQNTRNVILGIQIVKLSVLVAHGSLKLRSVLVEVFT